nr:hypothetical protein [Tanacetum cinerariifolium]
MILESVEHGPLIWPTIEENGVTRIKKYDELDEAYRDLKATNIILQVLMFKQGDEAIDAINKMMSFLSIVISSRFPTTNNQLRNSSNLRQQATIHDGRVTVQPLQGSQSSYAAEPGIAEAKVALMANLSRYKSDVLSEVPHPEHTHNDMLNQNVQEILYFEQTRLVDYPENEVTSDSNIIPYSQYLLETQNAVVQDISSSAQQDAMILSVFEQLSNQVTNCNKVNKDNLMANESLSDELERYKERQGDEAIDAINKMMSFLSIVISSRFPTTNNQLRNSSNLRQKATIHDGRVTVQPLQGSQSSYAAEPGIAEAKVALMANLSRYKSDVLSEVPHPEHTHNDMLNQNVQEILYFEQTRLVDYPENEVTSDSNIIPYSQYLLETQNAVVQDISSSAQQDAMILSVFEQLSNQVTNCNKVNKDNLMANESLSDELERYKERKAQEIRPMLYDGSVIAKETNVISIDYSEETLMLEEESRCKMLLKQSDPMVLEKKVNIKPINYAELNRLSKDFGKGFFHNSIKNDLRKLKGKDTIDNASQAPDATTIAPAMYKLDPVTLASRNKNNRETYMYYLKHTMEQAAILKEIVKQAKSLNPIDSASYTSYKYVKLIQELLGYVRDICLDIHKPSKKLVAITPLNNVKKVRISQPSSSNINNKVEAQHKKVNKKNRVVEPIRDANVKHTMLNANSQLICVTCKQCMFDVSHVVCFLDVMNEMNMRAKSKSNSNKKSQMHNIWKPTGKIFTEVGLKWKPTGRNFTSSVNLCHLTRITSTKVVPRKKTTPHSVETPKPELKVYSRRFKQAPCSLEYVPDPINLEDHVPAYIPEHPKDLVSAEDEAPIEAYILEMRAAVPSTYHSLLPSGTLPLLPIPLLVPSTSHRAEIPEADMSPQKRLLLTAPKLGCEVRESSAAARQPRPTMACNVDCSFVDTIETRFRDTERRMMIALEMVNMRVSYQVDVRSKESLEFYLRHHDAQKDRAAVRAEIE